MLTFKQILKVAQLDGQVECSCTGLNLGLKRDNKKYTIRRKIIQDTKTNEHRVVNF